MNHLFAEVKQVDHIKFKHRIKKLLPENSLYPIDDYYTVSLNKYIIENKAIP